MDSPGAGVGPHLPQGVCDEPVDGSLDVLGKSLGGQLNDGDRALGVLHRGAHGTRQPVGGQGRRG